MIFQHLPQIFYPIFTTLILTILQFLYFCQYIQYLQ